MQMYVVGLAMIATKRYVKKMSLSFLKNSIISLFIILQYKQQVELMIARFFLAISFFSLMTVFMDIFPQRVRQLLRKR